MKKKEDFDWRSSHNRDLGNMGTCSESKCQKDDVKDASPKHYVTKVSIPTPFSLNGQAESKQFSTLGLPSGKVQEIKVKNGQFIHKGDVILTTYDSEKQESKEEVQQELTRPKECSSLRSRVSILQNGSSVRHQKKMTATAIFKSKPKKHRALMMMLFLRQRRRKRN